MSAGLRTIAVVVVLLLVGAFVGSSFSQWTAPPPLPAAGPQIHERVRVEVLNGGGRDGMAGAATEALREVGFDVVFYGNATSFDEPSSRVLARVERLDFARAVADRLGIRDVRHEPDSNLYLDVTVVLGEDWDPPVDSVPEAPWWDVRRFFRGTGDVDADRPGVPDEDLRGRAADPPGG